MRQGEAVEPAGYEYISEEEVENLLAADDVPAQHWRSMR